MNLQLIITPQINAIVPFQVGTILTFNMQTVGADGSTSVTYSSMAASISVQPVYTQDLKGKDYYNQNEIYKRFYIQSTDLTGLNRNLSTGGDYVQIGSLYYKLVEVPENFDTGWVQVIGAQSDFENA